MQVNCNLI